MTTSSASLGTADLGQKLSVIAKDFGISEACVTNWMRLGDVDDGSRPGKTREESTELRDLRRRNRLFEQENEAPAARPPTSLRRTCRENLLPARERARR